MAIHNEFVTSGSDPQRVSAAELARNFAFWQERALEAPVTITYHGRDRLVLGPVSTWRSSEAAAGRENRGRDFAETSFSLLKENIEKGYILFAPDLRVVDINRAAQVFFGVSRDDVLGITLGSAIGVPDEGFAADALRRVARTGEPEEFNIPSLVYQGRTLHFRIYPHPEGAVALIRNITRSVELERALELSSAYVSAFESLEGAASFMLDPAGRLSNCSATLGAWIGAPLERLNGSALASILAQKARAAIAESLKAVVQGRAAVREVATLIARDHHEFAVELALAPRMEGMAIVGAACVALRCAQAEGDPPQK